MQESPHTIPPFVFAGAVREFWQSRDRQRMMQEQRGVYDRRLVRERQYTAACFLLADPAKADEYENDTEPGPDINAEQFLSQLLRTVGTGP